MSRDEQIWESRVKKFIYDNQLNSLEKADIADAVFRVVNGIRWEDVKQELISWHTENVF